MAEILKKYILWNKYMAGIFLCIYVPTRNQNVNKDKNQII